MTKLNPALTQLQNIGDVAKQSPLAAAIYTESWLAHYAPEVPSTTPALRDLLVSHHSALVAKYTPEPRIIPPAILRNQTESSNPSEAHVGSTTSANMTSPVNTADLGFKLMGTDLQASDYIGPHFDVREFGELVPEGQDIIDRKAEQIFSLLHNTTRSLEKLFALYTELQAEHREEGALDVFLESEKYFSEYQNKYGNDISDLKKEHGPLKAQLKNEQDPTRKAALEEQLKINQTRQRELSAAGKETLAKATALRKQYNGMFDHKRDKQLQDDFAERFEQFTEVGIKAVRNMDALVSWTVQHAVNLTEDNDLKGFYEHLAQATRIFRKGLPLALEAAKVAREINAQVDRYTVSKNGHRAHIHKVTETLGDLADYRELLAELMTLPADQKGLGNIYDVDADLARLGLEHLRADLPDRIPLGYRPDAPVDKSLEMYDGEKKKLAHLYDLGLRTSLLFSRDGDVLESDKLIFTITHGVGTLKSSVGSAASWIIDMMDEFRENPHVVYDAPREISAIVFGLPWHGYGPRDSEKFDRQYYDSEGERTEYVDFEPTLQLIDAVHERYSARRGEIPIGFGGRSTGGLLSDLHRQTRHTRKDLSNNDLPSHVLPFDFYAAMAAYSLSYFWVFHDTWMIQKLSPVEKNKKANWWISSIEEGLRTYARRESDDLPALLNMVPGYDISYPHAIPANIILDPEPSPEVNQWIREFIPRAKVHFDNKSAQDIRDAMLRFFQDLRDDLAAKVQPGQSIDELWEEIAQTELGIQDFWEDVYSRDPNMELHYDADALHNMMYADKDNPTTLRVRKGTITAQEAFLKQVLAQFQARKEQS